MPQRPASTSRHWLRAFALVLGFAAAQSCARADSVSPVSPALCADMKTRHVISANAPVGCERLALVRFTYIGFDGREHDEGELVVLDAVADQVREIFADLRARRFP